MLLNIGCRVKVAKHLNIYLFLRSSDYNCTICSRKSVIKNVTFAVKAGKIKDRTNYLSDIIIK